MASQSVSPALAVNDTVRRECSESLIKLKNLERYPAEDDKVDTLVQEAFSKALQYDGILPDSKTLVCNLQEVLERYIDLPLEDFVKHIAQMIEEAKEFAARAHEVADRHKTIGGELETVSEAARRNESSLQEDKNAYQEEMEEGLKTLREISHQLDFAIAFFTVAGVWIDVVGGSGAGSAASGIADFLVNWYLENKKEDCVLRVDETKASLLHVNNAIKKLSGDFSPCIRKLCNSMETLAEFFTLLHQELSIYESKLGNLLQNPVEIHYKLVKTKAKEIITGCRAYADTSSEIQIILKMIERNPDVTAN